VRSAARSVDLNIDSDSPFGRDGLRSNCSAS
jgi:hypothetical protein